MDTTLEYPCFLAIDASSYENTAHPVAIAWSLADGTVKTTLIQPEDDWEDWDYGLEDLHGITQDTVYERGETVWSVIRELENDIDRPFLQCDDTERCEALLERMYEACGRDLTLDVGSHGDELNSSVDRNDWYLDTAFHNQPCDERVRLMLLLWDENNNH